MTTLRLDASAAGASSPPAGNGEAQVAAGKQPLTLYVTLGLDRSFKIGTCAHCVIEERGRPARAWAADGDRELDFDRETLLAELAELGVMVSERQAYVCP